MTTKRLQTIEEKEKELNMLHAFRNTSLNPNQPTTLYLQTKYVLLATTNPELRKSLYRVCPSRIKINNITYFKFTLPKPHQDDDLWWQYNDFIQNANIIAYHYIEIKTSDYIHTTYKQPTKCHDFRKAFTSKIEFLTNQNEQNSDYSYKKPQTLTTLIPFVRYTKPTKENPHPEQEPNLFISQTSMYFFNFLWHCIHATSIQFQPIIEKYDDSKKEWYKTIEYTTIKNIPMRLYKSFLPRAMRTNAEQILQDTSCLTDYRITNDILTISITPLYILVFNSAFSGFYGYSEIPSDFIINMTQFRHGFTFFSIILKMIGRTRKDSPSKISYSLTSLCSLCGISLKHSKQDGLNRLNSYFQYLSDWQVVRDWQPLTIADFKKPRLNILIYLPTMPE